VSGEIGSTSTACVCKQPRRYSTVRATHYSTVLTLSLNRIESNRIDLLFIVLPMTDPSMRA
jgi:hypothetical protein